MEDQHFGYPECEEHNGQLLLYVCTSSDCISRLNRYLCVDCLNKDHFNHKVQTLAGLLNNTKARLTNLQQQKKFKQDAHQSDFLMKKHKIIQNKVIQINEQMNNIQIFQKQQHDKIKLLNKENNLLFEKDLLIIKDDAQRHQFKYKIQELLSQAKNIEQLEYTYKNKLDLSKNINNQSIIASELINELDQCYNKVNKSFSRIQNKDIFDANDQYYQKKKFYGIYIIITIVLSVSILFSHFNQYNNQSNFNQFDLQNPNLQKIIDETHRDYQNQIFDLKMKNIIIKDLYQDSSQELVDVKKQLKQLQNKYIEQQQMQQKVILELQIGNELQQNLTNIIQQNKVTCDKKFSRLNYEYQKLLEQYTEKQIIYQQIDKYALSHKDLAFTQYNQNIVKLSVDRTIVTQMISEVWSNNIAGRGFDQGIIKWRVQILKNSRQDYGIFVGIIPQDNNLIKNPNFKSNRHFSQYSDSYSYYNDGKNKFLFQYNKKCLLKYFRNIYQNNCCQYFCKGRRFNSNKAYQYGESYSANDMIEVLLNFEQNSLSFIKNGDSQGIAFNNIPNNTYFLVISMYNQGDEIKLIE